MLKYKVGIGRFIARMNSISYFNAILISTICLILILDGCSLFSTEDDSLHEFGNAEKHGTFIKENDYDFSKCTDCHGMDLSGNETDNPVAGDEETPSCYSCHTKSSHIGAGFTGPSQTHPSYMQNNNWDLGSCFNCHSGHERPTEIDFGGGCDSPFCHSLPLGPQACNTCHGNFSGDPNNPVNWAPAKGLRGETESSNKAVGSHNIMLQNREDRVTRVVECNNCHVVPEHWDDPGHINDDTPGRVELTFSFPADADSSEPVYNYDNQTCSSVYCHWGEEKTWTNPDSETECGSCHLLPPHYETITWTQCQFCHDEVWSDDGLIDQSRHVDGTVDTCSGECHGDM